MLTETIALVLTVAFFAYCAVSFIQFRYLRRLRAHGVPTFPPSDSPVSVIMGILSDDPELEKYVVSACEQDYPEYEVILVSNVGSEPGARVGRTVASRYDHVRHILVGAHDPKQRVGKNHALLGGLKVARNDIVLFGDADVMFEPDWITNMVSPIGSTLDGRVIKAVGAPVVVLPRNGLGRFFTLSSNMVMYLAAFARPSQTFPAYVSGHSMAIGRDLVTREVAPYWEDSFNDDLILAYVLRERGHALYYNPGVVLRPQENMSTWKRLFTKNVRWGITVRRFQHPAMRDEIIKGGLLNGQFTAGVPLALLLALTGFPLFAMFVLCTTYLQTVLFRYIIARAMGERFGPMILATPFSYAFFAVFFGHYYLWGRKFRWGEHEYMVERSFEMDDRNDAGN